MDLLNRLGYESTVVGNHEFDAREEGFLELMHDFRVRKEMEDTVEESHSVHRTRLLCANMHSKCDNITKFWDDYFIKDLDGGIRVAVIGVMGINSASVTAHQRKCLWFDGFDDENQQQKFGEYADKIRSIATMLKKEHHVDLVIISAHAGHPEDTKLVDVLNKSCQERLVDVHLSSHEHEETYDIHPSGTPISQSKEYGLQLGVIQLEYNKETKELNVLNRDIVPPHRITLDGIRNQELLPYHIPITDDIPKDSSIDQLIASYDQLLDESYLGPSGYKLNDVIVSLKVTEVAPTLFDFCVHVCTILHKMLDLKLANRGDPPLDFVLMGLHQFRLDETFFSHPHVNSTNFSFHDLFRMVGSGEIGPSASPYLFPGDSLVHLYLNRKDLMKLLNTNTIYYRFVNKLFQPAFSDSLQFKERWYGIPFINRLYDVKIKGRPIEAFPESHMFHVAVLDTAYRFLLMVGQLTRGLINFDIRDRFGRIAPGQRTPFKPVFLLTEFFKDEQHHKLSEKG